MGLYLPVSINLSKMFAKLTSKDKSLLLLIASSLVVIWALYSLLSGLFFTTKNLEKIAASNAEDKRFINVERALTLDDLKDRVILLDFWTYNCAPCTNILPQIKELQQELGNKLTIIGAFGQV